MGSEPDGEALADGEAFAAGDGFAAFAAEAPALTGALAGLSAADWSRPTRCAPWDVRDLLSHVRVAVGRLPGMLAVPAGGLVAGFTLSRGRRDRRHPARRGALRGAELDKGPYR